MITYVDSSGQERFQFQINPRKVTILEDAIAVLYLHRISPRSPGHAYSSFVGDWKVLVLDWKKGRESFTEFDVNDGTSLPMVEQAWHELVEYATTVLTALGVATGEAEAMALEELRRLRPRDGTAAHQTSWGQVKRERAGR